MFKRFDASNDVSTSTQVKASVQRSIKAQILKSNPSIPDEQIDLLLPKKPPLIQYKVGPHLMLYCRSVDDDDGRLKESEPAFFQSRDGPVLPCLKLVHQYPQLNFTKVTVDEGAIPFVLGGANIMCPGLTNPGGCMPEDGVEGDGEDGFPKDGLEKGAGVVIYAEGKKHALAVGVMKLSSSVIRSKNKGIGIEVSHFLGDGLYQTDDLS